MKNKKIIICNLVLFSSILLCSCGEKTDTTEIDEQISSFIKNVGEDSISLDEESNTAFIVEEVVDENGEVETIDISAYVDYADPHDDPELLLPEEKLPNIEGFSFDIPSMAEMQSLSDEPFEYLGVYWVPTEIGSPRQSYGKDCSLYLTTLIPYEEESPSICNELYIDLLARTIEYFGEPIYSTNLNVVDLENLKETGPISYMFKTSKYYLIGLVEDYEEEKSIMINYYFLSTEVPHSENNERYLIDFIRNHDRNFTIKVYYETSEGNFIL